MTVSQHCLRNRRFWLQHALSIAAIWLGPHMCSVVPVLPWGEVPRAWVVMVELVTDHFLGKVCQDGGPVQYLRKMLDTPATRFEFGDWLLKTLPEKQDLSYKYGKVLQHVTEQTMGTTLPSVVHPAALGFLEGTTTKPPTEASKARLLFEEVLHCGFITSSEPLIVFQPPSLQEGVLDDFPAWQCQANPCLPGFSLGYVKGQARTSTLLAILHTCYTKQVAVESVSPVLAETAAVIYVHNMQIADHESQALLNAKVSAKGSLRSAWNAITWVGTLQRLRETGSDVGAVILKWNGEASKTHQLVGSKRMAVTNLLGQAPEAGLLLLMRNVSEVGWENSVWTDDLLASKRLLPGATVRCHTSKKWTARTKMTDKAFVSYIRFMVNQFDKMPLPCRKKMERSDSDDVATQAAVVHNLSAEVQELYPIPEELLENEFVGKWEALPDDSSTSSTTCHLLAHIAVSPQPQPLLNSLCIVQPSAAKVNDTNITLEIATAVQEKSDKFQLKDIPVLVQLIEKHTSESASRMGNEDTTRFIEQASLDKQCFETTMAQLKFDRQAYKVYLQKYQDRETAAYHQKLQWKTDYHNKARVVAKGFIERWIEIVKARKFEEIMPQWMDFLRRIRGRHPLPGGQLAVLALLNWVSPCMLSSELQELQSTMMGCMVNDKAWVIRSAVHMFGLSVCALCATHVVQVSHGRTVRCSVCMGSVGLPHHGLAHDPAVHTQEGVAVHAGGQVLQTLGPKEHQYRPHLCGPVQGAHRPEGSETIGVSWAYLPEHGWPAPRLPLGAVPTLAEGPNSSCAASARGEARPSAGHHRGGVAGHHRGAWTPVPI